MEDEKCHNLMTWLISLLQSVDVLWQDYLDKLQEQVQDPLTKYLGVIPQIKVCSTM